MGLLDKIEKLKDPSGEQGKDGAVAVDSFYETRNNIHNLVLGEINKQNHRDIENDLIKKLINDTVNEHVREVGKAEKQKIIEDIYNDITGYGPLEELLRDPDVSEIMVNGPERVYIEKRQDISVSDKVQGRRACKERYRQDSLGDRPAHRRGQPYGRRPA